MCAVCVLSRYTMISWYHPMFRHGALVVQVRLGWQPSTHPAAHSFPSLRWDRGENRRNRSVKNHESKQRNHSPSAVMGRTDWTWGIQMHLLPNNNYFITDLGIGKQTNKEDKH